MTEQVSTNKLSIDCGGLTITENDVRQRMHDRNPEEAKKIPVSQTFGTFSEYVFLGLLSFMSLSLP
jgi:hypothetical protein